MGVGGRLNVMVCHVLWLVMGMVGGGGWGGVDLGAGCGVAVGWGW